MNPVECVLLNLRYLQKVFRCFHLLHTVNCATVIVYPAYTAVVKMYSPSSPFQGSPTQPLHLVQRVTSASPTSMVLWFPLLLSSASSRRACSMSRLKSASMRWDANENNQSSSPSSLFFVSSATGHFSLLCRTGRYLTDGPLSLCP